MIKDNTNRREYGTYVRTQVSHLPRRQQPSTRERKYILFSFKSNRNALAASSAHINVCGLCGPFYGWGSFFLPSLSCVNNDDELLLSQKLFYHHTPTTTFAPMAARPVWACLWRAHQKCIWQVALVMNCSRWWINELRRPAPDTNEFCPFSRSLLRLCMQVKLCKWGVAFCIKYVRHFAAVCLAINLIDILSYDD
jgi:hypothetical protein